LYLLSLRENQQKSQFGNKSAKVLLLLLQFNNAAADGINIVEYKCFVGNTKTKKNPFKPLSPTPPSLL
jgi:hypothetical protein